MPARQSRLRPMTLGAENRGNDRHDGRFSLEGRNEGGDVLKRLVMVAIVLAALVAACARTSSDHNKADVRFGQSMIPHHQQAIEMAEMASARAANPKVKELAARIKAAQEPEVEGMKNGLSDWGEAVEMKGRLSKKVGAMMSEGEMARLRAAPGPQFDRLFLTMMIKHHQRAIEIAEQELKEGKSSAAKDLAQTIKKDQQREVEEMRGLLKQVA
jgi:uncharacterized protein (DUF305 family)